MAYERKTTDILISDEIRDILEQIESESVVAKLLLKKRHDKDILVDAPVNWISISSQDRTKISYLTNERAEKMPESEHWNSNKRFHVKPGAFISKVFKNIDGREVEKFATLFKNTSNRIDVRFEIVKGDGMKKWYLHQSYRSQNGSLGSSCMRYQSCQEFLGIYTDNNVTSMLLMLDSENYLIGRALLWNFDDNKIMDRIYTISDEEYQFYFKEWATKNGYLYRSKQNWSDTLDFENLNTPKKKIKMSINLTYSDFDNYPYMDTFKFIDILNKKVYNYHPEGVKFSTLCSSEGDKYGSDYLVMDDLDGVFRYRSDAVYLDYRDIWTTGDNLAWSEVNNRWILGSDSRYDWKLQDYVFSEEFDSLNNREKMERYELSE